ncbi:MAG: NAD(P)/FAD-dependent oxidoreductase [Terrimicrobiaceae bacterium]
MENSSVDVCIIGAGLSGLSAARALTAGGRRVVILDKSRGLGGRAATRRLDGIPVDHGAQFFTARSAAFQKQTETWLEAGVCFEWSRGFHQAVNGRIEPPGSVDAHPRFACADGMTALAKTLGDGLEVRREHRVIRVVSDGDNFSVECEGGGIIRAATVFSSAPLPQTMAFAGGIVGIDHEAAGVPFESCLAVIAETTGPDPAWRGVQVREGNLAWIGADFTKRRERPERRFIVLHGSSEFSARHVDGDLDGAARILLQDAAALDPETLASLKPRHVQRWRFARCARPMEGNAFLRFDAGFYIIGDAFLQGKIESAWTSGQAAAADLLGR